jgi:osmoprotectant transport system permease protein
VRAVDPDLREAARGMGMRELEVLTRVEVPVALAVILAGIRVSAVAVVATAPLAALVGGGTLGTYILEGLELSDEVEVFAAAVLVALLALLTELAFAWLQRRAVSPGLARSSDGDSIDPSRQAGAGVIATS